MNKLILLVLIFSPLFGMSQKKDEFKKFEFGTLLQEHQRNSKPWYQFLDEPKCFAGIYVLNPGETDKQHPHEADEVYYIIDGKAALQCDDTTFQMKKGDIVFVRAGIEHRFFNIETQLKVLVFFSKRKSDPHDKKYQFESLQTLSSQKPLRELMKFSSLTVQLVTNSALRLNPQGDQFIIGLNGEAKINIDNQMEKLTRGEILFLTGDNKKDITGERLELLVLAVD